MTGFELGGEELAAALGSSVEVASVAVLDVGHEAGDAVIMVLFEDKMELVGNETKTDDVDGFGVIFELI